MTQTVIASRNDRLSNDILRFSAEHDFQSLSAACFFTHLAFKPLRLFTVIGIIAKPKTFFVNDILTISANVSGKITIAPMRILHHQHAVTAILPSCFAKGIITYVTIVMFTLSDDRSAAVITPAARYVIELIVGKLTYLVYLIKIRFRAFFIHSDVVFFRKSKKLFRAFRSLGFQNQFFSCHKTFSFLKFLQEFLMHIRSSGF
jgi:hypothetical protein